MGSTLHIFKQLAPEVPTGLSDETWVEEVDGDEGEEGEEGEGVAGGGKLSTEETMLGVLIDVEMVDSQRTLSVSSTVKVVNECGIHLQVDVAATLAKQAQLLAEMRSGLHRKEGLRSQPVKPTKVDAAIDADAEPLMLPPNEEKELPLNLTSGGSQQVALSSLGTSFPPLTALLSPHHLAFRILPSSIAFPSRTPRRSLFTSHLSRLPAVH